MNLGDVVKSIGQTIPGKIGIVVVVLGGLMAALYGMREVALQMDIESVLAEETERCDRSLEIAGEALKSGDPSEMVKDAREGNCMGQKLIDSSKEVVKDADEVLNPLSLPDLHAPAKLVKSAQRLDKAVSGENNGKTEDKQGTQDSD